MLTNRAQLIGGIALASLFSSAGTSNAQTAQTVDQGVETRLANQEQRIGEGLKDGSLTARESARLQREESQLSREWARAKADGVITPQERARMERNFDRASRDIYRERHDAQVANPNNPINQRLGNQAERIAAGIRDGSLSNREAARLERHESRLAGEAARFRRDDHLSRWERGRLNRDLNRESRRIYDARHNARHQ